MMTEKMESIQKPGRIESSYRMETVEGLELWRLGRDRFSDFNQFVYGVYSEAFGENGKIPFEKSDIEAASDEHFDHARVCAVIHPDGTLLGTWGLILKERSDSALLPIEKAFSLTTEEIISKMNATEVRYIFNGWRTAVDKNALLDHGFAANRSMFVFDLLLRGLTEDFGKPEWFLGVAEMEMLVLRYHKRVGLPWHVLGDPIHYWGRDRFPCALSLVEFRETLRVHHPDRFRFFYER